MKKQLSHFSQTRHPEFISGSFSHSLKEYPTPNKEL